MLLCIFLLQLRYDYGKVKIHCVQNHKHFCFVPKIIDNKFREKSEKRIKIKIKRKEKKIQGEYLHKLLRF